jgi:hypothetical protein
MHDHISGLDNGIPSNLDDAGSLDLKQHNIRTTSKPGTLKFKGQLISKISHKNINPGPTHNRLKLIST